MTDIDLLFSRRSIRKFTTQDIERPVIEKILSAAMSAPSACAKDPWQFHVIKNKEMLTKIADGLPNGKFLPDSAVGIVVCGDIAAAHGEELSYMLQDCSAAIENLLLAVTASGLGACWLGVHPRQDRIDHIKSLLNLPDNIIPISAIAIGHPANTQPPRNRYNPEKVRWDS